jgi:arginyl-tRNA synthetase
MNEVKATVQRAIKELYGVECEVELSRPEERFGDYASNVAMQLAPQLSKNPRELAEALSAKLSEYSYYLRVEVAGPGFINITLKDSDIWAMAEGSANLPKPLAGQEVLVEFGDPNPFKEMHIGHLYSYIAGDSISRLIEAQGATVRRLSYHGDVGLHVAKAMWGLKSGDIKHIGAAYAAGAKAYDESEEAKKEIDELNQKVYAQDDSIKQLYDEGRRASFENFDKVLELIGVKTHKRYLESQTAPVGLEFVHKNTPHVFKESDGAVIYDGEKVGLHTRVFITSKGLPTYEAKDLGLAELKNRDFPQASRSVIITANEQAEYFKVMLAALNEFDKALAAKTTHLTHGFVNLSTGKMSSRSGEVYSAMRLLLDVKDAVHAQYPDSPVRKQMTFAAVKYAFLKSRLGQDLTYDVKESISLEGSSGPYLQYAHARARAILQKTTAGTVLELEPGERTLARKISEYPEVVTKAAAELMPHHVAGYLYELAQEFNRFYEKNRVAGDAREGARAALVNSYAKTLKSGLDLLNIEAPERV